MAHHQGRTAVYRFYDKADAVIYVGITNNPAHRWAAHATDKSWWCDVATREVEWFDTREEAERIEDHLISTLHPRWNTSWAKAPNRAAPDLTYKRLRGTWTPSPEFLELSGRYVREQEIVAATRDEFEAEIVKVMMTGVSAHRISKFVPWGTPVVQAIGKRGNVPPLRPATVESIRKAKR